MNSDSNVRIQAIIDKLAQQLGEDALAEKIDAPIDQILEGFCFDLPEPLTPRFFHRVIGEFIRCLCLNALPLKRSLTPDQAQAEALDILSGYQSHHDAQGYGAALHDAIEREDQGIWLVLAQMAESIKARQREIHRRLAFAQANASLDWREKRRLAEHLLQALGPGRPATMDRCSADQIADDWTDLFLLYLKMEAFPAQISAKAEIFAGLLKWPLDPTRYDSAASVPEPVM